MQNEIKYTAFIDILGFSEHIKTNITNDQEAEAFYNKLSENVIEYFEYQKTSGYKQFEGIEFFKNLNLEFDYTWVSDTFVFSIKHNKEVTKEEEIEVRTMLIFLLSLDVSALCQYFITEYELCVRGAITSKYTYLKNTLILGEGISEANYLEKSIAINPRIVFANDILNNEMIAYINKQSDLIIQDCDGYHYVNYLSALKIVPPMIGKVSKFECLETFAQKKISEFFEKHQKIIEKGLTSSNEKVKSKYCWLEQYHKKHI